MKFFSPIMEIRQDESEILIDMMVRKKMQHRQVIFTLIKERKPRCKMKIHGRVAWFQEDLYLPKFKMKAFFFF